MHICSKKYWQEAASVIKDTKMLAFSALIVALRVAVKLLKIPLAAGLTLTFDAYVNSIGSMVYGPVMGLLVGAVSDTLGCVIAPSASGPYFLPFILVEMSSSFIFALFFWRRDLTIGRVLTAKFTVNFICNIILTSACMKWSYYYFYGIEKAETYALINLTRIAKNLIMFPLESMLIIIILGAVSSRLYDLKLLPKRYDLSFKKKHYIIIAVLLLLSIALVLFYIFFLKDFIKLHNIKLF